MSRPVAGDGTAAARRRVDELQRCLADLDLDMLTRWGRSLADHLAAGGRLLAAGNGGSAAEAQHLTAELVGRYRHDRMPLSALALHAETSSLTAIGNDYGYREVFARQVGAHGRPGDVLVVLSTSGRSESCVAAAERARGIGMRVWALCGPAPNPLADAADEVLCVGRAGGPAVQTATVQEVHLVAVHVLCGAVDVALGADPYPPPGEAAVPVGPAPVDPARVVPVPVPAARAAEAVR